MREVIGIVQEYCVWGKKPDASNQITICPRQESFIIADQKEELNISCRLDCPSCNAGMYLEIQHESNLTDLTAQNLKLKAALESLMNDLRERGTDGVVNVGRGVWEKAKGALGDLV
jgi:hypothetical protein